MNTTQSTQTNEVYTIRKSDNYSLKCWVKKENLKDNKKRIMFNYEIQRSQYLGVDKKDKSIWKNESLNLSRISDLCYIKKIAFILDKRETEKMVKKNHYFAKKIMTPSKKDPKKSYLTTYEIYKEYFCKKENKLKETKKTIFPCYDLEIFIEFLKDSITKINYALTEFEPRIRKSYYGDSKENYNDGNQFIDTIDNNDDEIPF